jgi:type I restriction enzyme S subunit
MPAHWEVARLKWVAKLGTGHTPSRQVPQYWEACTIPWLTLADVWQLREGIQTAITETAEKISPLGLANSAAVLHPAGTVVLSRTASVGFSGVMGVDMATSQDFATWTCGPKLEPMYLLYVLRAMKQEFRRLVMGSTHKTIYMPDIEALTIPLPPMDEQRAIVVALEQELATLDALARHKQSIAALLQERERSSLVNSVLGRDGCQELVPPSARWLHGGIPAHWQVTRLGRVVKAYGGAAFPHEHQGQTEGDLPFFKVADLANPINAPVITHATNWVSRETASELGARPAPAGTIVFPKVGAALLGNTRRILGDAAVFDNNVMGLMPTMGVSSYWFHLLRVIDMASIANPGPVPSINEGQVKAIDVPLPPIDEQEAIVARVDSERAPINRLRDAITTQLAALAEHREGLIWSAVTGRT